MKLVKFYNGAKGRPYWTLIKQHICVIFYFIKVVNFVLNYYECIKKINKNQTLLFSINVEPYKYSKKYSKYYK